MRPHSWFRRCVSFVLALLVLVASVGFTVQRMTCRLSGLSLVAVSVAGPGELRGCAGERFSAPAEARGGGCCDFSKQEHKLNNAAHELAAKILLPGPLLAVVEPLPSRPEPTAGVLRAGAVPRWFAADSSPPPLGGRALLALACTLVV